MTRYPLLLMLAFLGLSLLLWLLMPVPFGVGVQWILLGGALLAIGFLLILVAAGVFRSRSTTLNPTRAPDALVTDGVYGFSRNPMYLGMLLVLLGSTFLLNSLLGLVFPITFFWFMNWQRIPAEEMLIEEAFGAAYLEYRRRTRRWL